MYYAHLWLHCLPHLYIAVAEPRYFSETLMKPTRQNVSVKELGVAGALTSSNIILFSVQLKNGEVLSEISGLIVGLIFTSYSSILSLINK